MPNTLRNGLAISGLVITAAGLVLNLGNLRGWFAQADRVAMISSLTSTGAIPANATGFAEILAAFPPPARFDLNKISGLAMPIGIGSDDNAAAAAPPLQYRFSNGLAEPAMAFDELQAWSGLKGYPQLSLIISFVGFLITLAGVLAGAARKR